MLTRPIVVGLVAGAIVAAGAVFNLLGWIPTLLVIAVVGYVLYRLVARPKSKSDPDA